MSDNHTPKLLITLALTLLTVTGCGGVTGSGVLKSEPRQVAEFHGVEARGSMKVLVTQGTPATVKVEADDNLLPLLTTEVKDGVLVLDTKRGYTTKNPIKVEVTVPTIDSLSLGGSGSLTVQGELEAKNLAVAVGGAGELTAEGKFENVRCDMGGSGKVLLGGTTGNESITVGGSGNFDASKLQATGKCDVMLAGSGQVSVWADGPLNITIAGSGTVTHRGATQSPNTQVTGTGKVVKAP